MATKAISPPPPSGDFWARTRGFSEKAREFSEKLVDLEKRQWILICASRFEEKWRIGPEVKKACGEGGLLPKSASLHCRGNISNEEREQEQRTEADHSSPE